MKHKIWAFYINNGSIERRQVLLPNSLGLARAIASSEEEVRARFPFDSWYGQGTILKVVPKVKEKKGEICNSNAHHHHLLPGLCPHCGGEGGSK